MSDEHITVIEMLGTTVVLTVDDPELARYLRAVYADVLATDVRDAGVRDEDRPRLTMELVHRGDVLELRADGNVIAESDVGWWVLAVLVWEINQRVIASVSDRLLVHAGAVVRDDRAVLLVGASGTGKTTATLAMTRAGWGYLTDDVVVLANDGTVTGSPKPPTVRAGTPLLAGLGEESPRRPARYRGGDEWWAPASSLGARPTAFARLGDIVFIDPTPVPVDVAGQLEPLGRSAAVAELSRYCFNLDVIGQPGLERLADVVDRAWVWRRGDPAGLVDAFDRSTSDGLSG